MAGKDRSRWLLGGLGLLFLAAALSAPINHDESQYVAAIALMRDGLPFRDWPYLQTPLQPLLLSPLSFLPAGWLLVGARLANVLFALVACWAVLRLLRGRVPSWAAALAVAAMATTNAFLFGTEVARNDMLPAALLSLGMLALLPRGGGLAAGRAALAGLCLGLAVSAKISFALPVAGAGIWLLWQARAGGWQAVAAASAGGVVGLLPSLILYWIAPQQFIFEVFTYSLRAPQQFWTLVGESRMLSAGGKLGDLAKELVKGASAVALLLWFGGLRRGTREERLLDAMIVGGLLAAYLPDPFFRQYLIPLLPPLFARAGLMLPRLGSSWRTVAGGAGAATAAVGISGSVVALARAWPEPPLAEAAARGRALAAAGAGRVVTLSPEQVAGADVRLDPRFAAGPFLFRTEGRLADQVQAITGAPTFQQYADRPALILTGGERKPRPPLFPRGPDAVLDELARQGGYVPQDLGRGYILWRRPDRTRP